MQFLTVKTKKINMKFIFITCNVSVSERIISLLDENNVSDYQVADHVTAKNILGDPRFDTAVWPGYNVMITMQIDEDQKAGTILGILKQFNRDSSSNEEELLTVCSWSMDNYFYD